METTDHIQFLVEGSAPEPYEVTFIKDDNKLYATCTCQAAENQLHCKHRINILMGETKNIVSDNMVEVEKVAEAKAKLVLAKKELEQTMSPPVYDHDSEVTIIK